MKFKPEQHATVDEHNRLILPPEIVAQLGLRPGNSIPISPGRHCISVRQPITHLKKIYIEPTNQCNLACRMCIRSVWKEPLGQMTLETFNHIIQSIREISGPLNVVIGGFGEPLFHPHIITMIAALKELGASVELITNGTLLTEEFSRALLATGIDVLWLSLDGASPESYADVRLGAMLPDVLANMSRLRYSSWAYQYPQPHLGIVFVAMKRNIADLPAVLNIGSQLKADRFIITNVLPYTSELLPEVLYTRTIGDIAVAPSPWAPYINFSKMDMNDDTRETLYRVIRSWRITSYHKDDVGESANYCPFIEGGSTAISWDGSVSPCLPLMHSHESYLHDRRRSSRRHIIGNIANQSLRDMWNNPQYVALRQRVQDFDFSPCTFCGGCDLSEANEEDCFGNTFPTCGGCLWAQGVIQCP